ncbi:zinc finger protein 282-like isoform X2 [Rhineura floridana]|uniref:zinc finger protein 282-like isoform X2 n=1 Tax=Rhineura floridana TaxID=261503 RepID=UPI002AC846B0|nr:zinc finger protein 282-like isoform X2 [Rhineura floridana]
MVLWPASSAFRPLRPLSSRTSPPAFSCLPETISGCLVSFPACRRSFFALLLLCGEQERRPPWPPCRTQRPAMAEGGPPAQSSRWSSEVQAPPHVDVGFPKEAQLQPATISLWTVVGAVQAVERTVEAQALRLLSLEQRSGTAEKRFVDCEKSVAELGSQLESRGSALGTLIQEYGLLQKRLENMENLLKNWNFWVRKVPVGSTGEGLKVPATFGDGSSHFSREKWERLEEWQKELYKNVIKGNYFAVSKLENLACTEQAPHTLDQKGSEGRTQELPSDSKTESSISRTDIISWIKQEEDSCAKDSRNAQEGALCQSTCNYYTVSRLGTLQAEGGGDKPCDLRQVDNLEAAAPKVRTSGKTESDASRTDVVSWVKREEPPARRDDGGCQQRTCDSNDRSVLHTEEPQAEDPANPPLLLFFPGGSVAPIFNGSIGESQPLSNLHGTHGGKNPNSPAATLAVGMDRPHTCLECGKTFSLLLSLQIHQMNHQKRKHYKCSYCGVAFSCPSELVRHQMIHTGERPYKCTVCGKGFVRKQHLIPHLRLHTGERPYHCAECGKDFICKHHLLEHQRTHTGERPYACTKCGKKFRRKKSLKDHLRIHSAEEGQGQADSAQDLLREPESAMADVRIESAW